LNGQSIPEPSLLTLVNAIDREVDYVDAGDDDEEGGDTIPGDVRSLLKKVTNRPNVDVDTSNDSLSDSD